MKRSLTPMEKKILIRLLKQMLEEEGMAGGEGEGEQPVNLNEILQRLQDIGNRIQVRVTDARIVTSGGTPILQIAYNHNLFDLLESLIDEIGEENWQRLGRSVEGVDRIIRGLVSRVIMEVIEQFNTSWFDDVVDEKVNEFIQQVWP